MKLGIHPISLQADSLAQRVFSSRFEGELELNHIAERFRHRYGLSGQWSESIEKSGMIFSDLNLEGIGQICEVPGLEWYIGVQFHPEYRTRPLWPHVLFVEWIRTSTKPGR